MSVSEEIREQKYAVADPPVLKSKYQEFIEKLRAEEEEANLSTSNEDDNRSVIKSIINGSDLPSENEDEPETEKEDHFHCWVYVHIPEAAFFIEATTGKTIDRNFISFVTMTGQGVFRVVVIVTFY